MSPTSLDFALFNTAQNLLVVFHADRIDVLCSNKDLIIKAEQFERQVRRLEQERDAMEAKYEVCYCLARGTCL